MYAPQIFPSRLLQSLVSLLLIFLTSHAQDDEQFSECYSYLYNCSQAIQNIRYPFWGDSRLSFCGLEGFGLRCHNNTYSTIDINDQTFRVLRIDQSTRAMRIARNDLWEDICPLESIRNTTRNEILFRYDGLENENITLFYNCPSWVNGPVGNNFTCLESTGFFADESFSEREACGMNMSVPVLRSALEEFRNTGEMSVRELLNRGFNVQYIIDDAACSTCQISGGLCWNSANSPQSRCLCPNGPQPSVCPSRSSASDGGLNLGLKIGIGVGAASIVLLPFSICAIIYCIRKYSKTTSLPFWKRKTENSKKVEAFIKQYGSSTPRRYKYSDIKKITNSFKHELGQGGYGSVYKGRLADGRLVAVKVLNTSKGNGEDFINEVASMGRTSHVNVVTLLGFCYEHKRRALIYEFMSNGSLEKFIYHKIPPTTDQHLGGEKLYEIALGIARGLEYLHRGCNTRILHFDIKPHNILLNENFCPKISDFGLAKLYPKKESIVSMLEARGTIGYIAPEVFSRNFGGVSHKSDVYSYGMMVLEMVGGRKNIDAGVCHTSEIYFPHWIYNQLELDQDLQLQGLITIEENEIAKKMILVGLWCIQTNPSQRPSMNKVIGMLEGSMEALKIPPKPFLYSPQSPHHSSTTTTLPI